MRIAIIADVLGEENNGTTITVKRLIDHLKERGHQVKVVSPSKSTKPGYYSVDKIDFKIFNKYVAKNGVELAKPNEKILREVISDSDVVHILMPFAMGCAAARICRELSVPFTTAFHVQPENVSCHFGLQKSKTINKFIYKKFYKYFYRYAEYIHCPTRFIADKLIQNGYTADLRVISNGVDPAFTTGKSEKPEKYHDKFCILTTGRLTKEKRQKDLIRAVSKSKYSDKIQIIIAGLGPLEKKLRKLGEKLKNQPDINFHTKEDLVNIIHYCDLYVHPSYAEIESIACVEAITCGLVPVISNSRMSAARFFALSDKNLYKASSPSALAQRIDFMIEHPEFRNDISKKYIEYAEKFQIEKCIDKMEEMFNDALAHRHPSKNKYVP